MEVLLLGFDILVTIRLTPIKYLLLITMQYINEKKEVKILSILAWLSMFSLSSLSCKFLPNEIISEMLVSSETSGFRFPCLFTFVPTVQIIGAPRSWTCSFLHHVYLAIILLPIAVHLEPQKGWFCGRTLKGCRPVAVAGVGSDGLLAVDLPLKPFRLFVHLGLLWWSGIFYCLFVVTSKHGLG